VKKSQLKKLKSYQIHITPLMTKITGHMPLDCDI